MTFNPEDKAKFVDRTVVEHNDLISSVAKMDKIPLKMFELAVSNLNIDEPPENNTIHLSKKEMFSFFGVSSTSVNYRFKRAIERMQRQAYFEIREVKGKKGYKYRRIVPIPYIEWNDYDDDVTLRFDQAIIPYLIDLKKNFTQYALTDVMVLKSKYSVILYRWLSMNYGQYEYYRDHGGRTHEQLEAMKNPTISMLELRRLTDTLGEYDKMSGFTRWVLKNPCEEITENTHLNVSFEKVKEGRSVKAIRFSVSAAPQGRLPRKTGNKAAERQQQLKKVNSELYADAMASDYTNWLSKAMMLAPKDLMNQKLMIYLYEHVYPQYDELKKLGGGGVKGNHKVQAHIRYVSNRWTPSDDGRKNNKARYLDVAIAGYLVQVRGNMI